MKPNTIESVLDRLEENSRGCWVWTGCKSGRKDKYGKVKWKGKVVYVHRLIYEHVRGPISKELELDHLCENTLCANPNHLEAITHKENIHRGKGLAAQNAKKTHCKYGHPLSGSNLYLYSSQGRYCRECCKNRVRKYRQRKITSIVCADV